MINPILPCRVSWWAGGVTEGGVVHLSGYRTMVSARLSLISGASCVTVRQTDTASAQRVTTQQAS